MSQRTAARIATVNRSPRVAPSVASPTAPPSPVPHAVVRGSPGTSMKLTLQSIDDGGVILVRAEGSITAHAFPDAGKDPFEALLGSNWTGQRVLLDCAAVTSIDSSAIGWLINAQRSFKAGGGRIVVHSVQPAVKQILDVLKVGKVVPLADDETAARKLAVKGAR